MALIRARLLSNFDFMKTSKPMKLLKYMNSTEVMLSLKCYVSSVAMPKNGETVRDTKHNKDSVQPWAVVEGFDEEKNRPCKIYQPARSVMGSYHHGAAARWRIEFPNTDYWINPLMGWCSGSNTRNLMPLWFDNKEEAIRFCEKHGIRYEVQEPHGKKFRVKSYASNFKYRRADNEQE